MTAWTEVPFEAAASLAPPAALPRLDMPNGKRGRGEQSQASVFVGIPTYNGWLKAQALDGILLASERHRLHYKPGYGSLLAMNFNALWCRALNSRRREPWTHFAMLHADIAPPPGWLDTLLTEMARVEADVLSCCVAIKDDRRLTSTGVIGPDGNIRRLTVKEIHRLPQTFSAADLPAIGLSGPLVVNTGLWVCDFSKPWVEEVCFNVGDAIRREANGDYRPVIAPEDWKFSDWCNRRGLKVCATTAVRPRHYGEGEYTVEPGECGWDTDLGDGNPAEVT